MEIEAIKKSPCFEILAMFTYIYMLTRIFCVAIEGRCDYIWYEKRMDQLSH